MGVYHVSGKPDCADHWVLDRLQGSQSSRATALEVKQFLENNNLETNIFYRLLSFSQLRG
jgi:hypothetical protein